jgi:thymidylate synthase
VSRSTATVGVIDWESTTVEYQFGKSKSDKQIPDTTKEDLQSAREELDRMMQEAEVLRTNQHLEIRVREEKQMVEEKQKKYEELMTEYTYLGKDLRQVSSSLLEATEKQKGLQEAMMSARETRKKPNEYMERRRLLGNG